jgi:hypothetical protein
MRTQRQILPVASPCRESMDSSCYSTEGFGVKERYSILTLYL